MEIWLLFSFIFCLSYCNLLLFYITFFLLHLFNEAIDFIEASAQHIWSLMFVDSPWFRSDVCFIQSLQNYISTCDSRDLCDLFEIDCNCKVRVVLFKLKSAYYWLWSLYVHYTIYTLQNVWFLLRIWKKLPAKLLLCCWFCFC